VINRDTINQIMNSEIARTLVGGGGLEGAQRSIRLHLIIGLAVVMVLAGGLGGWASTQEISGALIAPGQIVVEIQREKSPAPDRRRGRRVARA